MSMMLTLKLGDDVPTSVSVTALDYCNKGHQEIFLPCLWRQNQVFKD